MKIYTKQGDKGKTQLLGGTIVEKDNERIECYGSIDELNAHIGHIYDHQVPNEVKKTLKIIQNKLFDTLKSKGLKTVEVNKGDSFDADDHEAVTQIPAPNEDLKGKIIDVIEKGYKLGEKVIRYPKVVIGK